MNRRGQIVLPLALLVAALGSAGPAIGQVSAASESQADVLFREAQALMAAGKYVEACPRFADSHKLAPSAPGPLFALAECYEKVGQLNSALVTYRKAESAYEVVHNTPRVNQMQQSVRRLEARIPKLIVQVPPETVVPGLEIRVDGAILLGALWNKPTPVDPGARTIEATATNRKKWSGTIQVGDNGAVATLFVPALQPTPGASPTSSGTVVPPPPPPTSTASPAAGSLHGGAPEPAAPGTTMRTAGYVVGGLGVVGVVVGTYFAFDASSKFGKAAAACPDGKHDCDKQSIDERDAEKDSANVSQRNYIISFIASGALLAGGAALVLMAPSSETTGSLYVGPRVGVGTAGLSLGGSW
jgi:hypothetical protein